MFNRLKNSGTTGCCGMRCTPRPLLCPDLPSLSNPTPSCGLTQNVCRQGAGNTSHVGLISDRCDGPREATVQGRVFGDARSVSSLGGCCVCRNVDLHRQMYDVQILIQYTSRESALVAALQQCSFVSVCSRSYSLMDPFLTVVISFKQREGVQTGLLFSPRTVQW